MIFISGTDDVEKDEIENILNTFTLKVLSSSFQKEPVWPEPHWSVELFVVSLYPA